MSESKVPCGHERAMRVVWESSPRYRVEVLDEFESIAGIRVRETWVPAYWCGDRGEAETHARRIAKEHLHVRVVDMDQGDVREGAHNADLGRNLDEFDALGVDRGVALRMARDCAMAGIEPKQLAALLTRWTREGNA